MLRTNFEGSSVSRLIHNTADVRLEILGLRHDAGLPRCVFVSRNSGCHLERYLTNVLQFRVDARGVKSVLTVETTQDDKFSGWDGIKGTRVSKIGPAATRNEVYIDAASCSCNDNRCR